MRNSITPRPLFTVADRRPEVYFYTSNLAKFLQANLIFQRAGLPLHQFASYTKPYAENYAGNSRDLLLEAVDEVTRHIGHASIVFVEDTTIRIEALSPGSRDFPGLETKEWFERTSFSDLDRQLRDAGSNRSCTVKSDIALHVPGLASPIFAHGETPGRVGSNPARFAASTLYPWLTPKTFNGWFIPDGADQPLGAMDLEASLSFDFRIRAFQELLNRLEELSAALNLPSRAYVRQEAPAEVAPLSLFPRPIYLVAGPTCAGKTTAAMYLEGTRGWAMIEASSVMRELGEGLGFGHLPAVELARRVTNVKGRDAVAIEIARRLRRGEQYIISGFRLVEELEVFRDRFPGQARLVFLDAPRAVRLGRMLARTRVGDEAVTLEALAARDQEQEEFGLIPFARQFADEKLDNIGTKEDLYRRLDAVVQSQPSFRVTPKVARSFESDQTVRCLKVLALAGRAMSCDEISAETAQFGPIILHNNVNKVLKRAIGLVRRIEDAGARIKYEALPAGLAYIQLADEARAKGGAINLELEELTMRRRAAFARAAEEWLLKNSPAAAVTSQELWAGLSRDYPTLTAVDDRRKTPRATCMRDLRNDSKFIVRAGRIALASNGDVT